MLINDKKILNDQVVQLLSQIDRVKISFKNVITRNKAEEAKDRIVSAMNHLFQIPVKRIISHRDYRRMRQLIEEVAAGKREMVLFKVAESQICLEESFSGKRFYFSENKNGNEMFDTLHVARKLYQESDKRSPQDNEIISLLDQAIELHKEGQFQNT